jgi:hypothetical protein
MASASARFCARIPAGLLRASRSITLTHAVAASRSEFDRDRCSYSISCEPATTIRSYNLNGQLFPLEGVLTAPQRQGSAAFVALSDGDCADHPGGH